MEFNIFPLQSEADQAFFTEEEYLSAFENNILLTDRSKEEARLTFLHDLDGYIENLPHHQVFIAKTFSGEYAGMIWLAQRTSKELWDFSDLPGWIFNIRVRPEYRGNGLGRALLNKAEEWAKSCNFAEIGLHVFGSNAVAINLYRSHGYSTKYRYMQKDITQQNFHSALGEINFKEYQSDQDQVFLRQLLLSEYKIKALDSASPTETQLDTGFEKCLKTYNFGNQKKVIMIAQDADLNPIGALWFYKSKGDLGKRRYIWVHAAQALDSIHHPHLLAYLETWAVQHELDAIRIPVHSIETQLAKSLTSYEYYPADLFMFKNLD